MNTWRIQQATERDRDLETVVGLIDDAARWLRTKDTDQWQKPWPSQTDRDNRLSYDLKSGKTWILRDGDAPAGTITTADTLNPYLPPLWPGASSSLYVHRLVIARRYAGRGLGAALLNWAGNDASEQYGAKWIRIDVWKTNKALHRYYERLGFRFVGYYADDDDDYPSSALFERRIEKDADTGPIQPLMVQCAHGPLCAQR